MAETITLKDPKTGLPVTFEWLGDAPPTAEQQEQVFMRARDLAARQGLIPPELARSLSPNQGPLAPPLSARPPLSDEESFQRLKDAVGHTLQAAVGIGTIPLTRGMSPLAAIGTNAVSNATAGGLSGFLRGGPDLAIDEAILGAGLSAAGDVGGKLIPPVSNMVAQGAANLRPRWKNAMAFTRERARQHAEGKLGIGIANENRAKAAKESAGRGVERAEDALTASGVRGDLRSVVRDAYDTMSNEVSTANFPGRSRREAVDFLKDYTKFQAAENTTPGLVGPSGPQLTPDVTPRRLGNMKRAHARRGRAIIEGRSEGALLPGEGRPNALMEAALEKANRNEQYRLDLPKNRPGVSDNVIFPSHAPNVGAIEEANQRVADLQIMNRVNKDMKDPSFGGRFGQIGTRMALGAALANIVGQGTGLSPNYVDNTLWGSTLGGLFLNPRTIGAVGNGLGVLSQTAVPGTRAVTAGQDIYELLSEGDWSKKKKVRRRDPK